MKRLESKKVCTKCKYYAACGDSKRVVPCLGMEDVKLQCLTIRKRRRETVKGLRSNTERV